MKIMDVFDRSLTKYCWNIFLICILIVRTTGARSQVVVTSSDSLSCVVSCTDLTADVTGYSFAISGITVDDQFSSVIPIGFSFDFYGTAYTQCIIGSNGVVSFNTAYAGSYNDFAINTTLLGAPLSGEPDIRNLIAGPWCDIDITGGSAGTITYAIGGIAPNRRFVVNFCDDHMFGCTTQFTTSQVILFETSNIIEVHIANKAVCASWNSGYAICGIVNAASTTSTNAPGRDFPSVWSATNEAWRFIPVSSGATYTVSAIPFAPMPLISSAIYWYNANTGSYITTGPTINVCPTTTTTYKAGALGCADTSFGYYTVTPVGALPPISGNTTICIGATTNLTDSVTGGSWSSSNSSVATVSPGGGLVSGIAAGSAIITYSTGSCITTTTVVIGPIAAISAPTNICLGATLRLSDATPGGTWTVSNTSVATITPGPSGGGILSGFAEGTVIITYATAGGCFSVATVNVLGVTYIMDGSENVCVGSSITLSNAAGGGVWSSGNSSIATVSSGGDVMGVSIGATDITYMSGTCTGYTTSVTVDPASSVIPALSNICIGGTPITLIGSPTGGTWDSNDPSVATVGPLGVGSAAITGAGIGTTTIIYSVSGCLGTATVNVHAPPSVISGILSVCVGFTTVLSNAVNGGTWNSETSVTAGVNVDGIVNGLNSGTALIDYSTGPGCTVTVSVTVYPLPIPGTIYGPSSMCVGAIYMLSDTTGGVWSSSNVGVATIDSISGRIHALAAGTTIVRYTIGPNNGGCFGVAIDTVSVTAHPDLGITVIESQETCYADSNGSISVNGGLPSYQYTWFNNSTASYVTGLGPGLYVVAIHDPTTQCTLDTALQITGPDSLHISAETVKDLCGTGIGSISTTVTGGVAPYRYLWSDNSTENGLEHLQSGTYTLTITDSNNCIETLPIQVDQDTCTELKVHNAITPNGDGQNDTWVIEGIERYSTNSVQVFDKWGDVVFEKKNYNNDWAGKGKSGSLPDGTYYYLVKLNAKNMLGGKDTFTGSLLIKR
jgi:gliding motility-associated-like protein